jgi:hypothetical protein
MVCGNDAGAYHGQVQAMRIVTLKTLEMCTHGERFHNGALGISASLWNSQLRTPPTD